MPSTTSSGAEPQPDRIGRRRRVARRRRRSPAPPLTVRLQVLWLRLRYRLRGSRYGHTPLTDPTNVELRRVDE